MLLTASPHFSPTPPGGRACEMQERANKLTWAGGHSGCQTEQSLGKSLPDTVQDCRIGETYNWSTRRACHVQWCSACAPAWVPGPYFIGWVNCPCCENMLPLVQSLLARWQNWNPYLPWVEVSRCPSLDTLISCPGGKREVEGETAGNTCLHVKYASQVTKNSDVIL